MRYLESQLIDQSDFYFFSKIFALNKYYRSKQDIYDLPNIQYKPQEFIFEF